MRFPAAPRSWHPGAAPAASPLSRVPAVAVIAASLLALPPAAGAGDQGPASSMSTDRQLDRVLAAEQRRTAAIATASETAVAIFAGAAGGGSGVLISPDGYALTNFHVVQPAGIAMRCGLNDGRLYDAVLVGLDPTGDLALIKLLGRDDFPHAELADSDRVVVGDDCFVIGNPFLLATDLNPSVSVGVVSGIHRYQFPAGTILEYADCLQVDAAINPGNSGGGLFDAAGRLIGINGRASFEKRGRINVGVGYAISANQVRNFLGVLKGGRLADHATLGATVATSFDGRVVVSDILESSDAWRRGLRIDDEVVALAGRPVRSVNAFKNMLGTLPAGWRVPLVYRRGGRPTEIVVELAGVHTTAMLADIVSGGRGKPKRPGPGDPEGQPPPNPLTPKPEDLPELIRPLYEPRLGFTNFHFNRVELRRVLDRVAERAAGAGKPAGERASWNFRGRLEQGGAFEIELADAAASIGLPTGVSRWEPVAAEAGLAAEAGFDASPPGSGGMLAALTLWRRLLLDGDRGGGRLIYWGQQPTAATGGLADVLELTTGAGRARFSVDPAGAVVAVDFLLSPTAEPCEIVFAFPADGGSAWQPETIVVDHAGRRFATFRIEELTP